MKSKMVTINTVGRRKTAVARATIKKGKGIIKVNKKDLEDYFRDEISLLRIKEPLIISGMEDKFDININVRGGGQNSQADAVRQAIAIGIVKATKNEDIKEKFLEYDRSLLVADTRFKEACKPNDSKARAKRQKSYR